MIKHIKKASKEEWDELVEKDLFSTYSQTREWYEIWSEYTGLHISTKLILFKNGKKVLLPLAYSKYLKGILKTYFSSPNGFGGFITNELLNNEERKILFNILNNFNSLMLINNPFNDILEHFKGWTKEDFTQIINLEQGFEVIFKKWRKGHICDVKKGMNAGLTIVEAKSLDEWKDYFHVYQDSIIRWGDTASSNYSLNLFEIMYKKNSPKIKLWLAKDNNKIISGALCFYHNKHVCYWHGAGLKEYFHLHGGHLLQYYIIKDACDKGFKWYDFNSSGGHENVIKFKNGFFTEKKVFHILILESSLTKKLIKFSNYIRQELHLT